MGGHAGAPRSQTTMGQLPMQLFAKLASTAEHIRGLAVKAGPQMGDRFLRPGSRGGQ